MDKACLVNLPHSHRPVAPVSSRHIRLYCHYGLQSAQLLLGAARKEDRHAAAWHCLWTYHVLKI